MKAAKAYAALIGSVATALLATYTWAWLGVVAAVCTAVATYQVPNLDEAGEHQEESVQPPHGEEGATTIVGALVALVVVLIILRVFGLI